MLCLKSAVGLFLLVIAVNAGLGDGPVCPNITIIETGTHTSPNGTIFRTTIATCNFTQTSELFSLPSKHYSVLPKREASGCSEPNCASGASCNAVCATGTPPSGSDCVALSNAIKTTFSGTFELAPGTVKEMSMGNCEYILFNNADPQVTLQSCWEDYADKGLALAEVCPNQRVQCFGATSSFFVLNWLGV